MQYQDSLHSSTASTWYTLCKFTACSVEAKVIHDLTFHKSLTYESILKMGHRGCQTFTFHIFSFSEMLECAGVTWSSKFGK